MRIFIVFTSILIVTLALQHKKNEITPVFLDTPVGFPEMPASDENPLSKEGIELGRMLFYDPILSRDQTFACATCHQQKFAFSDGKRKTVGIQGNTLQRNTPGLFNLAWYPRLFWDGRSPSIEAQVLEPVRSHDEMNLDWKTAARRIQSHPSYPEIFKNVFGDQLIDSILIAKAIAQFERSLISSNAKFDKVLRGELYLTPSEYRGFVLMNDQTKGNCLHCHTTDGNALGTTGAMSNNGLQAYSKKQGDDLGLAAITADSMDFGKFKIPSLRNLLFTAPYMHDGRFESLEQVVDFYSEGLVNSPQIDSKMTGAAHGGMRLSVSEKKDIVNFLKTLSDSSFVSNPKYASPFH